MTGPTPSGLSQDGQPSVVEPCTTWSHRLRHYSIDLKRRAGIGRSGNTLCAAAAFDQERISDVQASYGVRQPTVIADLRECAKCTRTLAAIRRDLGVDR